MAEYSGQFDLNFGCDTNSLIKYKNGSAIYLLKSLKGIGHCLNSQLNPRNIFCGKIYFHHASNMGKYDYLFENGQKFSDKFEFVEWKDIETDLKHKILDFHNLDKTVSPSSRIPHSVINRYIEEIAKFNKLTDSELKKQEEKEKEKYYTGRGESRKKPQYDSMNNLIGQKYAPNYDGENLYFNSMKDFRPQGQPDPMDAINLSNYMKLMQEGIVIRNHNPINAIPNFDGEGFSKFEMDSWFGDDQVKPIVLSKKKKKEKTVTLKVSEPIIL